ncbi:MAG TPA: transglycosylase SLT domain-containing protein [Verrucomicrobiae bacterium]|jgi:membrane-bound lytic murein transglycosylase D|nr:transglycosylase SLT domain-containing protein [Verrucomicrobiae bacterium]
MKVARVLVIVSILGGGASLNAQTNSPAYSTGGGVQLESVDDWLQDNIDPDVLRALKQLDEKKVQRIFAELKEAMEGTNINQLATLRQSAEELVPLLQKFEETAAYGDWLQTRLDYLEAAQELGRGKQVTMAEEREVWTRQLAKRPWPAQARNYVPRLKEIFLSEGVPPELVWVAEVESSFNPKARSPAGAAGMFQLMPQTARDEQLSLWPWDERYQAEKSARAAAKYLRALHSHYGDWELALAAYNVGEGRVDKLLKQRKARSFAGIARRLPAETQMYVPKVEATVWKREGRNLSVLKPPK